MSDQSPPGVTTASPSDPIRLTRAGHDRLQAELSQFTDVLRPEMVKRARRARLFSGPDATALAVSVAEDDVRTLDQRIKQLTDLLARVKVIPDPSDTATVQVGTRVSVRYDDGTEERLTIVSPFEADPARGAVSSESTAGKALLGKAAGDKVTLGTGDDALTLTVASITRYEEVPPPTLTQPPIPVLPPSPS